jgi:hypothetical protein
MELALEDLRERVPEATIPMAVAQSA